MTARLTDEVRQTLSTVADEVEVPPIDHAAFHALVGPARRRRTTRRWWWGAAAIGTATACVLGAAVVAGGDSDEQDLAPTVDADYVVEPSPTPDAALVGVVELVVSGPEGSSGYSASFGAPKDAYSTFDGVLVLRDDGSLVDAVIRSAEGMVESSEISERFDSLQVSSDGRTMAGLSPTEDGLPLVVHRDFVSDVHRQMRAPEDGRILAVQGDAMLVAVGDALQRWDMVGPQHSVAIESSTLAGVDATDHGVNGSWVGDVLALPRADGADTDLYLLGEDSAELLDTVPVAAGTLSPAGDNVAGFTADALDQPDGVGTADAIEIHATTGDRVNRFHELPALVTQFGWLDNDTLAVVGGDGEGEWPTRLDLYTCELADLTCTRSEQDPTGPDDELPILAGGTELPSLVD